MKFGFSITIARLLSPEDYGLVGMIVIFIAISTMITESGFGMALIQKKNADQIDYSTIFFFNVFSSVILYVIIFFTARLIADFYEEPLLTKITRVLSINIILSSLIIVQYSILSKQLNFKKQAIIKLFAALSSGSVGLYLAFKGFTVWALVIMTLTGGLITTILYWLFTKWIPSLVFSIKSFRSLYNYGYKIFLSGLSNVIFQNIYFPIIGKKFSTAELGYYTRADKFFEIFVGRITIACGRVTFPVFSQIQDQKGKFNNVYLKTYRLLIYTFLPFTMILMLTAKPFVHFFLTEKWMPAVPFMILFFYEGFFFPLLRLNHNILCAKGKSNISLYIELIQKALILISIFVFFKYGISGLIIGRVISSFISFFVSGFMIDIFLKIKLLEQLKEFIPVILIIIPGFIFCEYFVSKYISNDLLQIMLNVFSISLIHLMLSRIFKITAAKEFYLLLENYIPPKIKSLFF